MLVNLQENGTRESCQVERHVPMKHFLVSAEKPLLKRAVGAVPRVQVSAGGTTFRLTAWLLTTPRATNLEPSRTVTYDHGLQCPLGSDQATPPAPTVSAFSRTLRLVQKLTIINHFFNPSSHSVRILQNSQTVTKAAIINHFFNPIVALLFGRDQSGPPVSKVCTVLKPRT